MGGIPPPFPPLMSDFPPGYVIFSTLSLGSHVLAFRPPPSGFPTPGFPRGALPFPQAVPHSYLRLSSLVECRHLAVLQVALQV